MINSDLLTKCYNDYLLNKTNYQKMQDYYDGNTDAMKNYQMINNRANYKVPYNFIQKFILQESSYVCGNKITYTSNSNNSTITDAIRNNIRHWKETHDKEWLKQALLFKESYELHFINGDGLFSSIICTPLDSYILQDDFGNIELFIRFFKKKFDDVTLYADVYSDIDIAHYTVINTTFTPIANMPVDENVFGKVPLSIVKIGKKSETLFNNLKGLQDAYEVTLSNNVNELCDFRNAYLLLTGCSIDDKTKDENDLTDIDKMKSKGVLNLTEKDSDAKWLIKNINDVANKNTLQNIKDGLYEISSHFNFNDKLASNTSSLALKNQLIDLEQKCTHDIQSMEDGIKSRIKFLFLYLYKRSGLQYNWLDVDIKFSPNIPSDDLMMANIISQLNGKLSIKTGLKQLSFVDNVDNEIKELEKENQATSIGNDLLNNARTSTINNGGDNNGQAV